jgi:hypothetical protein
MRYGPTWLVFAAIAMLAPRAVQAQAAPELSSSSRFWGGGSFAVAPVGTHRWTRDGKPESSAFNTTYSLGALFDVRALPFVSIGVAPSVNFDFQDRETLLELPVRLTVGGDVASGVRLYAFATAGYAHSITFPHDNSEVDEPEAGFVAGAGGGVAVWIAPRAFMTAEIGYQLHALTATINDDGPVDISLRLRGLTLSLGLMAPFD